MIKTDLITGKEIYSSSINSLKDIKIELIKKINRFLFIDKHNDNPTERGFFHVK